MSGNNYKENEEDIEEGFCGACLAAPLAAAGVAAISNSDDKDNPENHDKNEKLKLCISIGVVLFFIFLIGWLYYRKCKSCGFDGVNPSTVVDN